jgi:hypothetical protein
VPALEKLLQNRLSPLNYQVKTADPTDGQVEMALKHIGDFGVRLMTVEEAVQNGATLVRWKTRTSAGSAFSSMKNGKKGKAAGFAGRARVVVRPHTMTELMENVPECLEINVDSQTPCYANEFDGLKNGVYQEQFTWNFMNGRRPDAVGLSGWHKVVAIFPMHSNFLFICQGASVPADRRVGCHVNLLTPAYNRTCGPAFGTLNRTMALEIPEKGPFAIGVGTSFDKSTPEDTDPPIVGPVHFRDPRGEFTVR